MSNLVQKKIEGFNMCLDPSDHGISNVLIKQGGREKAFIGLLKDSVKEGMVCMDLGANIGYATLFMARNVGKKGKVYAVEPDPRNFKILKQNILVNNFEDRCEYVKCAISDKEGEIKFWMASTPNTSSVHKTSRSQKHISVEAHRLDNFLAEREYPNFIKMDVEGHEVKILESGLDYFRENSGHIMILIEIHPNFYNENNDMDAIMREYFNIGFKIKYVISTPVAQPKLFKEKGYTPIKSVSTDGFVRGVYDNIKEEDFIKFACYENEEKCFKDNQWKTSKKIIRSFMMERV